MTFMCKCCMCDCEDSEQVQFKRNDDPIWLKGIYCQECMEYIRSNAWKMAKEGLLGVDCLAVFRNIQEHGLPTTLVDRDVLGNKSFVPISSIRYGPDGEVKSACLEIDLEPEQIQKLVEELRELDRKDVSIEDIKAIAIRYWSETD